MSQNYLFKQGKMQVEVLLTCQLNAREKRALQWIKKFLPIAERFLLSPELQIKAGKPRMIHCQILLCGNQRIRKLNLLHRKKDKVTDVLSFPAQYNLRTKAELEWEGVGVLPLGDLAICIPRTRQQAREFKVSFSEELLHLLVHGILHLCGYDHEVSQNEEKIMEAWEERLIKQFSSKKKGP